MCNYYFDFYFHVKICNLFLKDCLNCVEVCFVRLESFYMPMSFLMSNIVVNNEVVIFTSMVAS
jgi:hypothetical protein